MATADAQRVRILKVIAVFTKVSMRFSQCGIKKSQCGIKKSQYKNIEQNATNLQ
jgi:hypothetical protein